MYEWRRMTPEERVAVLAERKDASLPWHRPPHRDMGEGEYLISAACYEHAPVIGTTLQRMAECEVELLSTADKLVSEIYAWCLLPNHYHLLVHTREILGLLDDLGQFHGRTSHTWNGEDDARGRQVWHSCTERAMRTERHFWATLNYVHHNPVRHGYCTEWQEWPFSSARLYLHEVGREEAERIWREYPIERYGDDWDAPYL